MAKKNSDRQVSGRNIWKIFALAFITVFLIIVITGLIKLYHFNKSFDKATDDEIASSKALVMDYMAQSGKNITSDDIAYSDRIRKIEPKFEEHANGTSEDGDHGKRIMELSITKGNTKDTFLVDVDSKQIVMHSRMEFFSWMTNTSRHLETQGPFNAWRKV